MRRTGDSRPGSVRLIRFATAVLLLAVSGSGAAATASATDSNAALRTLYRQTAKAIASGNRAALERARGPLRDYPLLAALELAELRSRLGSAADTEVDAFLERNAGQRPAALLRQYWLARLAREKRWKDYLRYQQSPPPDPAAACTHAWATWQVSGAGAAQSLVAALWRSPRSLPAACDPLLAAWSAHGHPDAEEAWQRFDLAMGAGEVTLARYLIKRLDGEYRRDAELYLSLHDAPQRLPGMSGKLSGSARQSRAAAHALVRLASRDAESARRTFDSMAGSGALDGPSQREAAPRIALGLAAASPARATEWALGLPTGALADALAEDTVRYALRSADWSRVRAAIERVPPALGADPRWLYWRARADRELESGDPKPGLEHARTERSWYGFLAADRLGEPYSMQHNPVDIPAELLARVEANPGIRRAHEYDLLGESLESRREWIWVLQQLDAPEREAAATLAAQWGWHTLVIIALAQAASWDDLELRFPTPFSKEFSAAARHERLEPQWLFAIARQESAMNPIARSPAGALGLMQVMPATASLTAKRSGISYRGSSDLLNPATNVVIGSRYMRMMLDDFGGNRILAAAAYNAGPGRVRQWVGRFPGGTDHDVFVESIPFRETRQYVQNVMAYAVIYAYLQGRSAPLVRPDERRIAPGGVGRR